MPLFPLGIPVVDEILGELGLDGKPAQAEMSSFERGVQVSVDSAIARDSGVTIAPGINISRSVAFTQLTIDILAMQPVDIPNSGPARKLQFNIHGYAIHFDVVQSPANARVNLITGATFEDFSPGQSVNAEFDTFTLQLTRPLGSVGWAGGTGKVFLRFVIENLPGIHYTPNQWLRAAPKNLTQLDSDLVSARSIPEYPQDALAINGANCIGWKKVLLTLRPVGDTKFAGAVVNVYWTNTAGGIPSVPRRWYRLNTYTIVDPGVLVLEDKPCFIIEIPCSAGYLLALVVSCTNVLVTSVFYDFYGLE